MAKDDVLSFDGIVLDVNRSGCIVQVAELQEPVFCTLSGRIRSNNIKVVKNDAVIIETSPYDYTKGRIVRRHR